jgi:tRNA modification GTPase
MVDDTIVAIATPPGVGAIGVVRISGPAAVRIASRVTRLPESRELASSIPRLMHRAHLIDPDTGEELDIALVVRMPAPHSYTGEDVIELSCHGNPLLLGQIVTLMLGQGARLAEPGEFTKRAFLNGRLDLLQAEAVAALIEARTDRAVRLAARQLSGSLSEDVSRLRETLLDLVAGLEVALDFPDEDVGTARPAALKQVEGVTAELRELLVRVERGRAVREGLSLMLTGRPNVGKSSLLNALLDEERAIVSATPGTTRDLIETTLRIGGVSVRLIDGAGLGAARDPVDAEGMRRAKRGLSESDLVLVVLDRSQPISEDDVEVLTLTADQPRLLVANKADLPTAWTDPEPIDVVCSATTRLGIESLRERLAQWVNSRAGDDGDEGGIVVSLRVRERLEATMAALGRVAAALAEAPVEAVLIDLREAECVMGEALGVRADDDILGRIFAGFCVGK